MWHCPTFKAPKTVDDLTTLTFRLTAKYDGGHVATDTVDIIVIKKKGSKSSGTCFISTLEDD